MDVRNCRMCGKLYNYIGGAYRGLCPNCIKIMEDKFIEVKEFINDNGTATMSEISEACDVSVKQIEKWVREERLCFSDDSPIGLACEKCGAMIKSGRFCDKCKSTMTNELSNAYSRPKAVMSQPQVSKDKGKMRFLDN